MRTIVIPVAELLATVQPAYGLGSSWDEVLAELSSEESEALIIDELVGALERDGKFREPVVIDTETQSVANGMHRIAAALKHGAAEIEIQYGYSTDSGPHFMVELDVALDKDGDTDRGELLDQVVWSLRSFPLDAKSWAETDLLAARSTTSSYKISGYWSCPPAMLSTLLGLLRQKLQGHGLELRSVTAELEIS